MTKTTIIYGSIALLGAVAGLVYWYYWGCNSGCHISGNWYTSSAYGALLGYFGGGMLVGKSSKKNDEE